jgi:hypothetical protein
MVPTQGVIGTVIILVMLILTVVTYAVMRDPTLNVLFYTLMIGLSIGFLMCLIRISAILSSQKNKDILNPSIITFTSCPNYWAKKQDSNNTIKCINQVADSRTYVSVPVAGTSTDPIAINSEINLTNINNNSTVDKCNIAATYPWSEAYAKCP